MNIVVLNVLHVLDQQVLVKSVKLPEITTHQVVLAQMELMKILIKSVKIVLIHVQPVQELLIVVLHVLEP